MASKSRLAALDAGLEAAGPDMSIALLRVLVSVAIDPHLSVTELADKIGIPQQTASRYVAILQGRYQTADSSSAFAREPLLANRPSATDLRRYELVLTTRGDARLDTILNEVYAKGVQK